MTAAEPRAVVGQTWEDCDKRQKGRRGKVVDITETHAIMEWSAGHRTKVRLDRMRPTSTGFRLVADVAMEEPVTTLPARILVQVRDGVPNHLVDFTVPVFETTPLDPTHPDTLTGAKVIHRIDDRAIYAALAQAQRDIIDRAREQGTFNGANEAWLRETLEWVIA
ncbi:hypothetical protein [Leifsonia aquatica]|uniref:hypothetical protein n=1 Tax=Leifsonia aquatica TaxID=144185 RepID=UPI00046A5AD2|nr:hypothetical protein [Leifsonia aquatica]